LRDQRTAGLNSGGTRSRQSGELELTTPTSPLTPPRATVPKDQQTRSCRPAATTTQSIFTKPIQISRTTLAGTVTALSLYGGVLFYHGASVVQPPPTVLALAHVLTTKSAYASAQILPACQLRDRPKSRRKCCVQLRWATSIFFFMPLPPWPASKSRLRTNQRFDFSAMTSTRLSGTTDQPKTCTANQFSASRDSLSTKLAVAERSKNRAGYRVVC